MSDASEPMFFTVMVTTRKRPFSGLSPYSGGYFDRSALGAWPLSHSVVHNGVAEPR
jgi:hypothetical protein